MVGKQINTHDKDTVTLNSFLVDRLEKETAIDRRVYYDILLCIMHSFTPKFVKEK